MSDKKFDITKLDKLNHPERLEDINPKYIWASIGAKNVKTIADIGAGTGLFDKEFSRLSPESKIIALDVSSTMIEWMDANVIPSFPNISTLLMAERQIPLADASADVAIMINLHHELLDEMSILKECYRILASGGKIAICDWKKKETPKGPPLEIRFEPEDIETQLISVGFKNIRIFDELKNNWLVVGQK